MNEKQELVPGWEKSNDRLCRNFVFADFRCAFSFMSKVAELAEMVNHHPNWSNVYNQVAIELTSHDAGNTVSEKDIEMALAINRIDATSGLKDKPST
jgi:4a-hydroxytetrahydrobiopterin dehydratase